jgi:inositol transporter-like SP family MFS transporter
MTENIALRRAWWITLVAGMASFLDAAAIVASGVALVLYQEDLKLDGAAIGRFSALLTIMIAFGAVAGGRAGDRFGRRRVFTITMIAYLAGAVILAMAVAPWMIAVGLILVGFAAGADLPVSIAMISESAPPERRGAMVSFTHSLWVAGILVVNGLGIFVGDLGSTGARIIYGVLAAVALIVLVLRNGLPESQEWRAARSEEVRVQTEAIAIGVPYTSTSGIAALFRSRYVVPLIAVGLFFSISNVAANTNGQFSTYLYVNVAGASVQLSSTLNLIGTVVGLGALAIVVRLADTRFRMLGFAIGALLSILAYAIPAALGVSTVTLALTTMLFAFGGNMAGEPMFKVWSQELFPTLHRSTAQGIMIGFTRLIAAVVALVTPVLAAQGPQILFASIAAATAVAMAIGLFWIPRIRRADAAGPGVLLAESVGSHR